MTRYSKHLGGHGYT